MVSLLLDLPIPEGKVAGEVREVAAAVAAGAAGKKPKVMLGEAAGEVRAFCFILKARERRGGGL